MKEMMAILVRCVLHNHITAYPSDRPASSLNGVPDPGQITPDGRTVEERMQKLCEAAAEDIKHCANVCDTYLK